MEKYRIHPTGSGKNIRMSYQRQREVLPMPNLIEVQKNSYQWFREKGLQEVLDDISLRKKTPSIRSKSAKRETALTLLL